MFGSLFGGFVVLVLIRTCNIHKCKRNNSKLANTGVEGQILQSNVPEPVVYEDLDKIREDNNDVEVEQNAAYGQLWTR